MTHFAIPDLEAEKQEEETRLLKCEVDTLRAKIAALQEAGDAMANEDRTYCPFCGAIRPHNIYPHHPDCPVTKWQEVRG